jgi:hypothetical protein
MRSVSCERGVLSPGFSLSIWVAAGLRLKPELRTPGFILSGRRNATWIISVEKARNSAESHGPHGWQIVASSTFNVGLSCRATVLFQLACRSVAPGEKG